MGRKITPRGKPPPLPKPPKDTQTLGRTAALFKKRSHVPVRLKKIRACGPAIQGAKCVSSWQVELDEGWLWDWMVLEEEYGNVKKLFHGTPARNVAEITQHGLRKGSSRCMFGSGIYFGSLAKAFGYTSGYRQTEKGIACHYVFEAEVVLGKCHIANHAQKFNWAALEELGCQSVHGFAGRTASWGGTLRHDEYVIYQPEQVLLRKLHEYQQKDTYRPYNPTPRSAPCEHVVKTSVPVSGTFGDILSRKPCGNTAYQQIGVSKKGIKKGQSGHHTKVWVCENCVRTYDLRIGTKILYRSARWGGGTKEGRIVIG